MFVGIFACRCAPLSAPGVRPDPADRVFLQLAIARDSLSAPFARLRRNAIVSASAAVALLLAVGLIALRIGPYIRGKQLEGQLELARQVQQGLLPAATVWPVAVDGAAACVPASVVGGDFYDVQDLPGGQLAFSLGDVSGHGISAALLMSMMHGAMSGGGVRTGDRPDETLTRLNELLLRKSSGERFASMISCVYDPRGGRLQYVNAGHPPALLIHRDERDLPRVSRLGDGGPVLGVLQDVAYHRVTSEASEGDLLVLFSDGIVEATNESDEYFGEGRLLGVIEQHRHLSAGAICDAIIAEVQTFSGRRVAEDDRTVLVVRLWRVAAEGEAAA
jgi:sigma-B regulation protein RsbU (phosphoserine phosphatase)